jgi:hypothetical protein
MQAMLDLYTDYLICSTSQVSATVLSRLTDGEVSRDQITRFLRDSYLDSKTLWKHAKPLVRKYEDAETGVLLVDDCIAEKEHTDENAMICWHWDHSKNRYVKGLNFVSLLYHNQDLSVPIGVTLIEKTEPVHDPKTCSDITLTVEAITTIYKKRWKVEEYHKSLKQNTGLTQSPTKIIAIQANHFMPRCSRLLNSRNLNSTQKWGILNLNPNSTWRLSKPLTINSN